MSLIGSSANSDLRHFAAFRRCGRPDLLVRMTGLRS
jgi:hypothetical protein